MCELAPSTTHHQELLGMRLTDLRQKRSHLDRIHLVTETPVQFPMQGTDAAINVSEFALVAVEHHRAQRSRSPTTSDYGPRGQNGPRPETSAESDARARPEQSAGTSLRQ